MLTANLLQNDDSPSAAAEPANRALSRSTRQVVERCGFYREVTQVSGTKWCAGRRLISNTPLCLRRQETCRVLWAGAQ